MGLFYRIGARRGAARRQRIGLSSGLGSVVFCLALVAVIAGIVAWIVTGISNDRAKAKAAVPLYAACQEEDGSTPGQVFPCLWDAQKAGNGQGQSFILITAGGEPRYAYGT